MKTHSDAKSNASILTIAQKLFDKRGSGSFGDAFQIHCPCENHDDTHASCSVTVRTDTNLILVHCPVCDSPGKHEAYKALVKAGDLSTSPTAQKTPWKDCWEASNGPGAFFRDYFESRGIPGLTMPDSFRINMSLYHKETKSDDHVGIIASVVDENDNQIAIHRTYLNEDGDGKLTEFKGTKITDNKKLWGSANGGHTVLRNGNDTLHVAEGIETAFAILKNLPAECSSNTVWSALSGGNLAKLQVPARFKKVLIYGDHDLKAAGKKFALKLANRLHAENRTVSVLIPDSHELSEDTKSIDWLDAFEEIEDAYRNRSIYAPEAWDIPGVVIPDGYDISNEGVWFHTTTGAKAKPKSLKICTYPIFVSAKSPIYESASEYCEITYYREVLKKFETFLLDAGALSSPRDLKEQFLSPTAFSIDHRNVGLLCTYLTECRELCTTTQHISTHTGWVNAGAAKIHAVYSPNVRIKVTTGSGEEQLVKAFRKSGSYEKWKSDVLSSVTRCYGTGFVFAASLAAPLLSLFNVNSIPITMTSSSGAGKTVSAHAALSSWCNPKEIEMSGSSSIPGLKNAFSVLRDVPTLIDEVQLKATESLGALIYDIGNSGRTFKATKDGSLRKVSIIHTTALFTGERGMSRSVSYDGANVRMISLTDIDLLGELRNDPDAIDRLRRGSVDHYGHFGPRFIAEVTKRYNDGTLKEAFYKATSELESDDPLQIRQCERYAAMIIACDILGELLESEYGDVLKGYVLRHWSEAVEEREPELIANRALARLGEYVIANSIDFGRNVPRDRSPGEWQSNGNLAIQKESLQKILGDLDAQDVLRSWKARGWLDGSPTALKRGYQYYGKIHEHERAPCYLIKAEAMATYRPKNLIP